MADVEIGRGRVARRGYDLDDIAIVPSRRTRDVDEVSIGWDIDAFRFELPLVTHPSDAIVSPTTASTVDRLGGLAVLDGEGLWTRYEEPEAQLARLADVDEVEDATALVRAMYAEPVRDALITARVKQLRDAGVTVALRLSPQHTLQYHEAVVAAGVDLLVIQGTIVSAEHVSAGQEPLNLKQLIADLDVPVLVGGCTNYQTALHLMRTGAAGVIVGIGAGRHDGNDAVLGIHVPMATAITEAAAARRDYLDETGGRYVHVIADGDIDDAGHVAKALACGADAVMLGEPLAAASDAPGFGWYWLPSAAHPKVPRSKVTDVGAVDATLEELLVGPATDADGDTNLFGALRRSLAKCGYSDLKEFQKVDLLHRA